MKRLSHLACGAAFADPKLMVGGSLRPLPTIDIAIDVASLFAMVGAAWTCAVGLVLGQLVVSVHQVVHGSKTYENWGAGICAV